VPGYRRAMPTWNVAGLIEGFYGRPWSWDERVEVCRWCADRGMTDYVYAPKDDPKHRERWRDPYDDAELAGFERLATDGGLRLGFAISPGLSMDYDSDDDRRSLAGKVDQVVAVGARLVVLALDDIPFGGVDQGDAHGRVTTWLRDHLDPGVLLALVPTGYVGTRPSPYLEGLARSVPAEVPIGWTGRAVVNRTISATEARERASSLGGRSPWIWDNYPVNDNLMGDLLPLGPLRGRDPDLSVACDGYLANAMVQPRASKLPLASTASWLRGEDPVDAWAQEADALGWRALAQACDGELPRELVEAVIAGGDRPAARAWFEAVRSSGAPGVEDEVGPWLEQAQREARLALRALRLLDLASAEAPDHDAVVAEALTVVSRWRDARTATSVVMGERWAFRFVLSQAPDGRWHVDRESLTEDRNAVDALVRHALDAAAAPG
jgi:hyaluronoglucosaminidase